jgi:uncharacterized protein involved in exopolysaccharide biosynthesis
MKPQLDATEKAVREFKIAHYGALPEQQEGNLRTLDQTTLELNIQATNLDLDEERRRELLASAMSPLRHQEEILAGELYDARTRYTLDHPEVRRIQAEYDRVRQQRLDDERGLNDKLRRNNPELAALEGEIARNKAFLSGLRTRQTDIRRRVEATAKNAQRLVVLEADYNSVRDKYNATLSHLRDAQLAAGLEKGLANLRVDLIESASVPTRPMSANRALLALGALLIALALGMGVGFGLDVNDSAIRDPEQLRDLASRAPILAVIPKVDLPRGAFVSHGPKAEA